MSIYVKDSDRGRLFQLRERVRCANECTRDTMKLDETDPCYMWGCIGLHCGLTTCWNELLSASPGCALVTLRLSTTVSITPDRSRLSNVLSCFSLPLLSINATRVRTSDDPSEKRISLGTKLLLADLYQLSLCPRQHRRRVRLPKSSPLEVPTFTIAVPFLPS